MDEGEGDVPVASDADVPLIYKKESYAYISEESKSGLDKGVDVVDGKLREKSQYLQPPLHGVLHHHENEEDHHTQHHVHIVPPLETATGQLSGATDMQQYSSRLTKSYEMEEYENEATAESMEKQNSMLQDATSRRSENDNAVLREIMQEVLQNVYENQQKKIQINKGALKTLQTIFNKDDKQGFFLESILASRHVKDLTSRYGSKAKNVRQFFLEAVDADTRLAVFGAEQTEEVQETLQKLAEKRTVARSMSVILLDEEQSATGFALDDQSGTDVSTQKGPEEKEEPLIGVWSKKNFWDSLERLEFEQMPDHSDLCTEDKTNPLFEIYGPKTNKRQNAADANRRTSLTGGSDLEPYPDKYLEHEVQEVQQSEAVRRLWENVNERLKLFNSVDPLTYQMFGGLYDEVRNFVQLPEEEIISFNNGNWEPDPLDEKKILLMEPFEKLMTRFVVYQKAFCFLAQHFETLTPIFGEIKQAYEDVFEKGEKETLEVEKEQMEELELRQTLGKHVRFTDKAGHRLLMQVKAEAHALQEHIRWQHHTLHTILGMLWKMRSSLKLTNWAVGQLKNMHKTKIEDLAKEIVSTQGQLLFDMALPGKYTEIMQRIRDSSDPKEIRRMLLAARRQLRAAHRK